MILKKGDTIKIITGNDKNRQGKILEVDLRTNRVIIEGLNLVKKHRRPKRAGQKGEVVQIPRPISASNVMLLCPKCGEITRPKYNFEGGKKYRVCRKCGSEI